MTVAAVVMMAVMVVEAVVVVIGVYEPKVIPMMDSKI
jgi:hypothetical protein